MHGWDGYPEEGWFPWLKKELEAKDFEVYVPQLPEPDKPRIYNWVPKLAEVVGQIDSDTYLTVTVAEALVDPPLLVAVMV